MAWKIGLVWLFAAALLIVVLIPLSGIQVVVDLPSGTGPSPAPHKTFNSDRAMPGIRGAIVLIVAGGAAWATRRVVRKHRRSIETLQEFQ